MSYLVNLFAYQREIVNSIKDNEFPFNHLDTGRYSPLQVHKFPDLTIHYRVLKTNTGYKVVFKNYEKPSVPHKPLLKGNTIYLYDGELSRTLKINVRDFIHIFKKESEQFINENEEIDFNLSDAQKELLCTGHDIALNVYRKKNGTGNTSSSTSYTKVFSTDISFFKGKTKLLISDCQHKKLLQHRLTNQKENHY